MKRARRAIVTVLLFLAGLRLAAIPVDALQPGGSLDGTTWTSSTLVVSEVATGGASASDEFVEIANQGTVDTDLAGLEVAYVTATGSTVTRKGSWAETLILGPGKRVLLANAAGSYAVIGDASYTGGLAATGGVLVLRPIGGAPIDAVGWGDAANAFVESRPAAAPPAGSSIERRPGGLSGNAVDTNDNLLDWLVQASPSPQNLAAPPVPAPVATPTPTSVPSPSGSPTPAPSPPSSPTPTPSPSSTPAPAPTPTATPTPTPAPTPSPTPSPAPTPGPSPSASPAPTATPSPTPTPTPTPTSTPTPATPSPGPTSSPSPPTVTPIGSARLLPDDATVTIAGTLTTRLGALESGRTGFVEDASGGVALYLDAALSSPIPVGSTVTVTGPLDTRYGQRTVRVTGASIVLGPLAPLPGPLAVTTGGAREEVEGRRIRVAGSTVGAPSSLSDGTGLLVDDGTGQLRIVATAEAMAGRSVPGGTSVTVRGPLGQRDSGGSGLEGYRLYATEPGDLVIASSPNPTPTPTPAPTASPSPSAAPSPTPPAVLPITDARQRSVGDDVTIEGVVTAEPGRLDVPPLIAVQDGSGAILVRLPDGVSPPARGARIQARGRLAQPYGQLEVRPESGAFTVLGSGSVPAARSETVLGEASEALLIRIAGRLDGSARRASGGDIAMDVETEGGIVRVMAAGPSGLEADDVTADATYELTGIIGQRASRKGRLDGYRLWLRDVGDVRLIAGPASESPSPGGAGGDGTAPPAGSTISVARAVAAGEGDVVVEAVVTAGADLLDASGRRIVVQDTSAAVEVLLPSGSAAPAPGSRIRIAGEMGRAYGAPRLRAESVDALGTTTLPGPIVVTSSPGAAHEWRLVRVSGTVADVTRLGTRWRAELDAGGGRVVVSGLPGAEVPSTAIVEGRRATVTGIVRRPYPSASDRRFAVVPRSPADVALGPAEGTGSGGSTPGSPGGEGAAAAAAAVAEGATDVDLGQLAEHVGRKVRVGGLVVEIAGDGFVLNDGTATGRVVLRDGAAPYIPLLELDDAVNAIGEVERHEGGHAVVVRDAAGLVRVGDLGETVPMNGPDGSTGALGEASAGQDTGGQAAPIEPAGLAGSGVVGLAVALLLAGAAIAGTLMRKRRLRQQLMARVAARLARPPRRATAGAPTE